jgi:hypothetical protein
VFPRHSSENEAKPSFEERPSWNPAHLSKDSGEAGQHRGVVRCAGLFNPLDSSPRSSRGQAFRWNDENNPIQSRNPARRLIQFQPSLNPPAHKKELVHVQP